VNSGSRGGGVAKNESCTAMTAVIHGYGSGHAWL
jgi:hypothetical protein